MALPSAPAGGKIELFNSLNEMSPFFEQKVKIV